MRYTKVDPSTGNLAKYLQSTADVGLIVTDTT